MSCGGCSGAGEEPARRRTNAAVCCLCTRGGWRATHCRKNGTLISTLVGYPLPACPLGKHAGADGLVRWAWLRWRGLPHVLRLALEVLAESPHVLTGSGQPLTLRGELPGCGCIDRLKAVCERWAGGAAPAN